MPERTQIILITLDLDFAELLLDSHGLLLEAQALRQEGNLTAIFDPTPDQLKRLEAFFHHMNITYRITWAGSEPEGPARHPRHSAP